MESIMGSISFFVTSYLLGYLLWNIFFRKKTSLVFEIAVYMLIGSCVLTWIIYWQSVLVNDLHTKLVIFDLVIVILLGAWIWGKTYKNHLPRYIALLRNKKTYTRLQNKLFTKVGVHILLYITLLLITVVYFVTVFTRMMFIENGNLMAGWINVWGDWMAHLAYTSSFAYGDNFPTQFPVFTGTPFGYPFMANFMSAILVRLRTSLPLSLIVPGILFSVGCVIVMVTLIKSVTKNTRTALFATALFFFNGGLGFVYLFFGREVGNQLTHFPEVGIEWISVITSQLIPQRGFVISFPMTLINFYLLHEIWRGGDRRIFVLVGLLTGILPLFHMHSFLFSVFIAFWVFLATRRMWRNWILYFVIILVLAVAPILHFYSQGTLISWIRFKVAWANGTDADPLMFMVKNFGMMLVLPVLGFILSPRRVRLATMPLVLAFIIAHLFVFQPWDWDNTKIITFGYLSLSVLGAVALTKMIESKRFIFKIIALILFVICTFSGFYDAINILDYQKNKYMMFSKEQMEIAEYIRENTPQDAIFLTADNHDHLVTSLAGRKTVMGYPGWLWSYGINYYNRQNDVNEMKTGGANARKLMDDYHVSMVFIGPVEISQGFNRNYFDNFLQIYDEEGYTIYQIN